MNTTTLKKKTKHPTATNELELMALMVRVNIRGAITWSLASDTARNHFPLVQSINNFRGGQIL